MEAAWACGRVHFDPGCGGDEHVSFCPLRCEPGSPGDDLERSRGEGRPTGSRNAFESDHTCGARHVAERTRRKRARGLGGHQVGCIGQGGRVAGPCVERFSRPGNGVRQTLRHAPSRLGLSHAPPRGGNVVWRHSRVVVAGTAKRRGHSLTGRNQARRFHGSVDGQRTTGTTGGHRPHPRQVV